MDFPINIRVYVLRRTYVNSNYCYLLIFATSNIIINVIDKLHNKQTLSCTHLTNSFGDHTNLRLRHMHIYLLTSGKAKVYQTVVACDSRITSGSGCFRKGCYNRIQVRRTTWATLPPCHSRISACTLCSFLLVRRREIPVIQEAPSREYLPNPSVTLC